MLKLEADDRGSVRFWSKLEVGDYRMGHILGYGGKTARPPVFIYRFQLP